MEQTSEETNAPEAAAESAAIETPAAPVRRRASRRVTAAAGTVVEADAVAAGAPSADASSAEPAAAQAAGGSADASASTEVNADPEKAEAPKKRVSRARKKVEAPEEQPVVDAAADAAQDTGSGSDASPKSAAEPADAAADQAEAPAAKKAPATRRRRQQAAAPKASEATEESAAADAAPEKTVEDAQPDGVEASDDAKTADESGTSRRRNTRTRSRKAAADSSAQSESGEATSAEESESAESAEKTSESSSGEKQADKTENGASGANGRAGNENGPRSSRTRQRERKRRGGNDDEPEITADDVLLPIAGILDVLDNYAFVRTSGYLPGTGDVYVSLGQVKKYGLRKGDAVVGAIRQPREGEGGGRQKYNAIVKVDTINSKPYEENQTRPDFADFTPIHPNERVRLETEASELGTRIVDLFSPVGKGQRGLIVGPHEAGKSTALQQIAQAVSKNQPDAHLMLVLIDERPEEVTALERTINGEVIASTFDRPAEDHTTIAELAVERAKRLVELGHDVVLLIDSLTGLARAYNLAAPAAVRVPAGSLDAAAIFPVKRLLSAARNIENGGSLTMIATVSAQPDSRLDEALLGELEGVANMQLRLSGDAADRRVFPAIDLGRSATRNESLLTSDAEAKVMNQIRHALADENQEEGLESVLKRIAETSSNVEFLTLAQRGRA